MEKKKRDTKIRFKRWHMYPDKDKLMSIPYQWVNP